MLGERWNSALASGEPLQTMAPHPHDFRPDFSPEFVRTFLCRFCALDRTNIGALIEGVR